MGKPFKLANGLLLLSTEAPGGVYNSAQLKKIASLCDGDSSVVKATEDQRLALFVAADKAAKIAGELKAVGLGVRHYQDGLHQAVNCLGEMCSEHLQDAMGTSMELTKELSGITLGTPLKIGINGCARCCLATHTLDISIIGDTNGYRISLGGKNSQLPEMASFMAEGVPAAKLPKLIAKVVSVYKELAQKDETLQEVTERAGSKKFIEALAPYSQDAHQDDPFTGLGEETPAAAAPSPEPEIDADFGAEPTAEPNFEDTELSASPDGDLQVMEDSLDATSEAPVAASDDLELSMDLDAGKGDEEALMIEEPAPASADELTDIDTSGLDLDEPAPTETLDMDMSDVGEQAAAPAEEAPFEELSFDEEPAAPASDELAVDDLELDSGEISSDVESLTDDATPLASDAELEELSLDEPLTMDTPAPASKPAVAAAPAVDEGEDLTADEVSDADADAFEEKLNASIAEEESFPEIEDVNSHDRLEAMKLVEAGGEEQVHESLATDGGFDNLGIEHDEEVFADEGGEPSMPSATHGAAGFEFVGFDLSGDRVSLTFSSGASVAIDPRMVPMGSRRSLTVGGKKITIATADGGLEVEVDGVAIFVPKRAA